MSYPKWPSEVELRRKNRVILAERLHWPDGVLQACVDLESRHPGWHVSWMKENITPGFERPAGFSASYDGVHKAVAFDPDPAALSERIADQPPPHEHGLFGSKACSWCRDHPRRLARL